MAYNSFNQKDEIKKKVVLRIRQDIHKIKEGICLSQHSFETVKRISWGALSVMRWKVKVTAELGFALLVYTKKRAINMVGTRKLTEAMQE